MVKTKQNLLFAGGEKSIRFINPSTYGITDQSFYNFLGGSSDLQALEAIRLYKNCMPFFRAIELRAETFSSIPIRVKDRKNNSFVESHPILELLGPGGKPNPSESLTNFLKSYSSFRDVTGQAFLCATGLRNRPPIDVLNAKPQNITIGSSSRAITGIFQVPSSFDWNTDQFNEVFKIDQNTFGRSYRYWSADDTKELWQSGEFNPTSGSGNYRGFSKAGPISLEIQQFIEGNVNNLSVLSRGARPSVAWVSQLDEPLTDDQYERWKEQVNSYEGALNAGKQVLVDAVEPKIISTTNKDMEFKELKNAVRTDIFVQYQIPLALVSPEQMTLNNLTTSVFQLYDISVLPHADNLLEELTLFLMPRYKNSENLYLTYNGIDIKALKERAIEETGKIQKLLIASDNELRDMIGLSNRGEEGDIVYKPLNIVPSDTIPGTATRISDNEKSLEEFRKHCQTIVRPDGKRVFSDIQIEIMAKEHGLINNISKNN